MSQAAAGTWGGSLPGRSSFVEVFVGVLFSPEREHTQANSLCLTNKGCSPLKEKTKANKMYLTAQSNN